MEGRKQFTFYRSYYDALMQLPVSSRGKIFVAIMEYGLFGIEPEGLNSVQKACFFLIKPTLEAGIKRSGAMVFSSGAGKKFSNKGEKEKEKEIEIEKEKETETEDSAGADFERFWNSYPVKIGKAAAMQAWKQVRPQTREVSEGLERWLVSCQWKKEGGRYIPRAAKFITEKHYLEEPKQVVPMGATGKLGEAELDAIRQIMEGVV